MDRRLKTADPSVSIQLREELYKGVASGALSIPQAVKLMRQVSRLTQPEFAAHRGISAQALRQIEGGTGNPTVETLNKVAGIFGLEVGFVAKRSRAR